MDEYFLAQLLDLLVYICLIFIYSFFIGFSLGFIFASFIRFLTQYLEEMFKLDPVAMVGRELRYPEVLKFTKLMSRELSFEHRYESCPFSTDKNRYKFVD